MMDTRELFARLIRCEAEGEGENGMKAVATVVMNRVRVTYGEYRDECRGDLRRVIEQMCQFSCYKTEIYGTPNYQNVWSHSTFGNPLPYSRLGYKRRNPPRGRRFVFVVYESISAAVPGSFSL